MYSQRNFIDEADYQQMRKLLSETYSLSSPPLNCLVGEIDWWRSATSDLQVMSKVRLWFDFAKNLVAFTWTKGEQIEMMIDPQHRELERQIFQTTEDELVKSIATNQAARCLTFYSYEHDSLRNSLLTELGYQRVDSEFLACHRMRLQNPIESKPVPEEYTLRTFKGEAEIESRVEAHCSAFHPSKMTVEKYRNLMSMPSYRQDMDFVAVAANGEIVACAIVWWDEANRVGIFEPVGCHQEHQRRGLAKAVMTEGLKDLYARGAREAIVMSEGEDSGGANTYRSLGFELIGKLFQWKKEF